jgi:hypothetical protein
VFGTVGRSASLDLHNSGCSQWTIADVAGDAALQDSGAGSVKMGAAGRLDLRLSGAGEIHATRVRGLEASLSGVGSVSIDELAGPMEARVSGVGKIRVANGRAGAVRASVSGMGSVEFGGAADSLDCLDLGPGKYSCEAGQRFGEEIRVRRRPRDDRRLAIISSAPPANDPRTRSPICAFP